MSEFFKAWGELCALESAHAEHVKGFRLGTYPDHELLRYTILEIYELMQSPGEIDEMADILLCLAAYCKRHDWTPDQLGAAMRKKLRSRFKDAEAIIARYDIPLAPDEAELEEALVEMVEQHCAGTRRKGEAEDPPLDSYALSANARAMRVLAKRGRLRIEKDFGRCVTGKVLFPDAGGTR